MIINKQDSALNEAMSILENAEYLSEDECLTDPSTIAIFEHELGYIVEHSDIDRLCEDYGIDQEQAIESIAEANEIDPDYIKVSIPEEEVYLDESIVEDYEGRVVFNPISKSTLAYKFVDEMVDAYAESADEDYLYAIIDEDVLMEADVETPPKKPQLLLTDNRPVYKKHSNAFMYGGVAAGVAVGGLGLAKILKEAKNKPKSWIAKKIASLRSVYSKWLKRAQKESNSKKANAIKKVAAKILAVIDKLMAKLQTMAD